MPVLPAVPIVFVPSAVLALELVLELILKLVLELVLVFVLILEVLLVTVIMLVGWTVIVLVLRLRAVLVLMLELGEIGGPPAARTHGSIRKNMSFGAAMSDISETIESGMVWRKLTRPPVVI